MEELISRDGTVHKVIYQNEENGYAILLLLTEEGEKITVVGSIPCAAPGEHLTVSGTWKEHSQYGRQLQVKELERCLPEDEEEILLYLSSGACKGIGPSLARQVVERFGCAALEILEEAPERLSSIKGISDRKAREIGEAFRNHMGLRRLMAFLAQYELPLVLAMQLRQQYGDKAMDLLRKDPYMLAERGVRFGDADRIALDLGLPADSGQRIQAAVLYELQHNMDNGHVFIPRGKLIAATAQFLDCGTDQAEAALDSLIGEGGVVQEHVGNVEACYLRRLWEAETSILKRLGLLLEARPDQSSQAGQVVDSLARELGLTFAAQQRKAVELAARANVMILTGGPGTGKTTTVRGIIGVFQRMGLRIVQAAPTGRAAMRMSEATGMEAQTIHRLLGTTWNEATRQVTFTKCEKEPLEANAVIVDEMSMVDMPLFSALLRALRPGTRLVLVGDADQLPPVGPGNVFYDLLRSGRVETVFLREIFRQAEQSAIVRNAYAVNRGEPPRLVNDQPDFFFFRRRDPDRATATITELCKTRLPQKMHIPPEQIQVLSPTRKGPCGTVSLNRLLQEALNPPSPSKRQLEWGENLFREGDRIMQTQNDYNVLWQKEDGSAGAGIFNGDIGKIRRIDPGSKQLELDFEGRRTVYSMEQLGELDLAYALTVHKTQGGEYRAVILAAMPAARSLMVRGVLYTAITRARELMLLVGDDETVRTMAKNYRQQQRYSGLYWRLASELV